MELKEWVNHWNGQIKKWYESPQDFLKNSIESQKYKGSKSTALVSSALPEPYIGDPFNCSAVILNLNPGGVMEEYQNVDDGIFITKGQAHKDYYKFTKGFHYFTPESKNRGSEFWVSRFKWINRLIGRERDDFKKLPFALEIVPFHSKGFGSLSFDEDYINYLNQFLIEPAKKAVENADLPFVLTVGKPFLEIFNCLGFSKIIELDMDNFPKELNWPLKGSGEGLSVRYFSLWKSQNGTFFYNTRTQGNNKMPSAAWSEIESYVLSHAK